MSDATSNKHQLFYILKKKAYIVVVFFWGALSVCNDPNKQNLTFFIVSIASAKPFYRFHQKGLQGFTLITGIIFKNTEEYLYNFSSKTLTTTVETHS